jgi:hypothetical protein
MKRCPTCNQTFEEEWLSFCTLDGTTLMEEAALPSDPPPTVRGSAPPPAASPQEQATWNLPSDRGGSGARLQPPPIQGWQPPPPPSVQAQNKSLAIAAMIIGIISVTVGWMCFGPIPAIAAIIMGAVSHSQIKKNPERVSGKQFAWVGVITGSVTLVIYACIMVLYIVAAIAGAN